MRLHGRGTAVIATSVVLLMNLSEVMKTIVKLAVNVETLFAYFMVTVQLFRNLSWNFPLRILSSSLIATKGAKQPSSVGFLSQI
jgi:hypothetical protein